MKKLFPKILLLSLSLIIAAASFYGFFIHAKKPKPEAAIVTDGSRRAAGSVDPASTMQPSPHSAWNHLILAPLPHTTGADRQAGEFPAGVFAEFARPRPPFRIAPAAGENTPAATSAPVAEECAAIAAIKTASLLQAYRGGLIEINEKEENADRIVTAALTWAAACQKSGDGLAITVTSTLRLAGNEPIALALAYRILNGGIQLEEVTVTLGPSAAKVFAFTGLEGRPTGQKRGSPVNAEVETTRAGVARFRLAGSGDGTSGEGLRLLRHAQWIDFPLLSGARKFILAIELPVTQALMPN